MDIEQKRKLLKEGMFVLINENIRITDRIYNSSKEMRRMAGSRKPYKVESVNRNYVIVEGYTWDLADITIPLIDDAEKPEMRVEMFDSKELLL